jgi:hypothetical protein
MGEIRDAVEEWKYRNFQCGSHIGRNIEVTGIAFPFRITTTLLRTNVLFSLGIELDNLKNNMH